MYVLCLHFSEALRAILLKHLRKIAVVRAPSLAGNAFGIVGIRLIERLNLALQLSQHFLITVGLGRIRAQIGRVLPCRHGVWRHWGVEPPS